MNRCANSSCLWRRPMACVSLISSPALLFFGFLFATTTAFSAAAPSLRELSPRGAQRGKMFTLYLRGEGLTQGAEVKTTLPAIFSRVTLTKDPLAETNLFAAPNSVLPFLVTLRPDTPTGFYPIRVITPGGISNVLLFTVGDLPEIDEIESKDPKQSNDSPVRAQKIPVPVTVNGTLDGADVDIDNYVFNAKAGQKLVFEVEARRAGSAVDPAIEIFDSAGRVIGRNDDAPGVGVDSRLEVTFAKAGPYRVSIHDSKYSAQTQNFYRLKIGSYEYADSLFPLGWRRNEPVEVTLLGGNLAQPVKVKPDVKTKSSLVPVRLASSSAPPLMFALSDQQEMLEPPSGGVPVLPENTIMNGRISEPREIDRYQLAVEPGQKWVFELTAASLGTSRLDAILTVFDSAGKKLATGDDGNGFDPVLPFSVPKDVKEIAVSVEDLFGRGGPEFGYRLLAKRQQPDFTVELQTPFVNVPAGGTAQVVANLQRRGYAGEIRLTIPNLPAGFTLAGGHIPPEAAAQDFNNDNAGRRRARSVLTITAAPDAKPLALEVSVVAEAHASGEIIRREARGPGMVTPVRGVKQQAFTAPWLEMKLPIATTGALPVTLTAPTPLVRIAQGFEYGLEYRIKREGAAKAGKVINQIAGAVGNLRVLKGEAGKNPDAGAFLLNTNFATPATTFDMLFETQTEVDGKPMTITSPAIEIQVVPGYEVQLSRDRLQASPGGKIEIAGKVRREPTFEGGAIRLQVEDLPDGVKCPEVTVPAEKSEFTLACEASAEAKPGSFPVRIASTAPETGRKAKAEYKIADLNTQLVVTANAERAGSGVIGTRELK